jgi:hypothetical protein
MRDSSSSSSSNGAKRENGVRRDPATYRRVYDEFYQEAARELSEGLRPLTAGERYALMQLAIVSFEKKGKDWLLDVCIAARVTPTHKGGNAASKLKGIAAEKSGMPSHKAFFRLLDEVRVPGEYLRPPAASPRPPAQPLADRRRESLPNADPSLALPTPAAALPVAPTEVRPQAEVISQLRAAIAHEVGQSRYELWFPSETDFTQDEDRLIVEAPSLFFHNWIRKNFRTQIAEACVKVLGKPLAVEFRCKTPEAASNGEQPQRE